MFPLNDILLKRKIKHAWNYINNTKAIIVICMEIKYASVGTTVLLNFTQYTLNPSDKNYIQILYFLSEQKRRYIIHCKWERSKNTVVEFWWIILEVTCYNKWWSWRWNQIQDTTSSVSIILIIALSIFFTCGIYASVL